MPAAASVTLRAVEPADLDVLYRHQLDPEANRMAAFVRADPSDRAVFDAHWQRVLSSPGITQRTVVADGDVAGHIACFPLDGELEVTYWIGREFWGRGIATSALRLLLKEVTERPIFGRAASDHHASIRVLEKCGFELIGHDRGFAVGRGEEIEESILRLGPASAD